MMTTSLVYVENRVFQNDMLNFEKEMTIMHIPGQVNEMKKRRKTASHGMKEKWHHTCVC